MTSPAMSKSLKRIAALARNDGRYKLDAYLFVQQALAYAQVELKMGYPCASLEFPSETNDEFGDELDDELEDDEFDEFDDELDDDESEEFENGSHLTGQQLCEAARLLAADLYGRMAKVVLNSWGIRVTRDFGEIVYKLIEIGEMTKSEEDRLEDFDDVYDFEDTFNRRYVISPSDES